MRTLILISSLLITSTLFAQNDGNTENRSKNGKRFDNNNTYHLEKIKIGLNCFTNKYVSGP